MSQLSGTVECSIFREINSGWKKSRNIPFTAIINLHQLPHSIVIEPQHVVTRGQKLICTEWVYILVCFPRESSMARLEMQILFGINRYQRINQSFATYVIYFILVVTFIIGLILFLNILLSYGKWFDVVVVTFANKAVTRMIFGFNSPAIINFAMIRVFVIARESILNYYIALKLIRFFQHYLMTTRWHEIVQSSITLCRLDKYVEFLLREKEESKLVDNKAVRERLRLNRSFLELCNLDKHYFEAVVGTNTWKKRLTKTLGRNVRVNNSEACKNLKHTNIIAIDSNTCDAKRTSSCRFILSGGILYGTKNKNNLSGKDDTWDKLLVGQQFVPRYDHDDSNTGDTTVSTPSDTSSKSNQTMQLFRNCTEITKSILYKLRFVFENDGLKCHLDPVMAKNPRGDETNALAHSTYWKNIRELISNMSDVSGTLSIDSMLDMLVDKLEKYKPGSVRPIIFLWMLGLCSTSDIANAIVQVEAPEHEEGFIDLQRKRNNI